jgi:DNA-nicking Smr family endonuclease
MPPPTLTGIAQLLSETPVATLDLHGYTQDQTRLRVRNFLITHARISGGSVVHIITGKSTAVLLELVRDLLDEDDDDRVKEQAGMLGGGGWVVRLK